MEQKRRADKGKVPAAKRGKLNEEKLTLNPSFLNEDVKRQLSSSWRYAPVQCPAPLTHRLLHVT